MTARPAAGGGRWVTVAPERLDRWLTGFAERHGPVTVSVVGDTVVHTALDGAVATVEVPFPPLSLAGAAQRGSPIASEATGTAIGDPHSSEAPWQAVVEHVLTERVVGVLLVRLGGHAAGVFEGPRLVASKVGSRNVQGRSAAGGWSQQRFARRRAGQAVVAHAAAADDAAKVLLGRHLDALVVGGDRTAVDAVLADRRLVHLQALVTGRLLAVPDPRLKVLQEVPFRDVWVRVQD